MTQETPDVHASLPDVREMALRHISLNPVLRRALVALSRDPGPTAFNSGFVAEGELGSDPGEDLS
jgi:hypothetical protein